MEKKQLELLTELSMLEKAVNRKITIIPESRKEELLQAMLLHFKDLNKVLDRLLEKDK